MGDVLQVSGTVGMWSFDPAIHQTGRSSVHLGDMMAVGTLHHNDTVVTGLRTGVCQRSGRLTPAGSGVDHTAEVPGDRAANPP